MQLAHCNCLNDPSIYIINRKSLLADKSQVFYNDDASSLLCLPLMTNSLKWSESFLGDTMLMDAACKYEEPICQCTMDFDWPKISLFKIGQNDYHFLPHNTDMGLIKTHCQLMTTIWFQKQIK